MSQDNIVFPFLVLKTSLRRLWNKPCFLRNQRFLIKWYGFQNHFKIYQKNSTKSHEGTIGHIYHPHLRDEKEDHVLFKACIVQIRWLRLPDCGPFTMLQWKLLEGTQIWNFYGYFHTAIRWLHGSLLELGHLSASTPGCNQFRIWNVFHPLHLQYGSSAVIKAALEYGFRLRVSVPGSVSIP